MRKISAMQASGSRIFKGRQLTIGLDLGDLSSRYCVLDDTGYDLHSRLPTVDIFTPWGSIDAPTANASLSTTPSVSGWAIDEKSVARVDIYVARTGRTSLKSKLLIAAEISPCFPACL